MIMILNNRVLLVRNLSEDSDKECCLQKDFFTYRKILWISYMIKNLCALAQQENIASQLCSARQSVQSPHESGIRVVKVGLPTWSHIGVTG